MFYTYVSQLPMVTDNNLTLSKGTRLEFEAGSLRKSKADQDGFRSFVIYDKSRDVTYRASKKGLQITAGESLNYEDIFIPTRRGPLKYTPFAMEGEAAEINSFIVVTNKMSEEYIKSKSFSTRAKAFLKDPLGKAFILAIVIYTIATTFVMYFG